MDRFFPGELLVHLIGDERSEGRCKLGYAHKHFIGGRIYRHFVFGQVFLPEPSSRSPDIPVRQVFGNKILDLSYRLHVVVPVHFLGDLLDQAIVLGQNPAVKLRPSFVFHIEVLRVDIVLVGIKHKEIIYVPQRAEELAYDLNETVFIKFCGRPGRRCVKQIPSRRIGAVLVKELERIHRIALCFGHLLSFFIEDQVVDQYVPVRRLSLDKGGNRDQRIEPASGLVDSFTDEISREQFLVKVFLIFKRIMMLGKRHRAAVEPAIHDFRDPGHGSSALFASDMDLVHIRSVQFDVIIDGFHRLLDQLFSGSDGFQMSAFASPDINRRAPVSVSGDRPVVDIFQPVSETLFSHEIREPVYSIVIGDQLILQLGHFDIPARLRIVDQRSSASPAMRIIVLHFLLRVDLVFRRQPLDDLHVELRIQHKAAGPWSLGIVALLVHRIRYRQAVFLSGIVVVFTESRRGMNDTGAVFNGDIVVAGHIERLLIHLDERHELFIFDIFQILTLHFGNHFIGIGSQDLICKGLRHIVYFPVLFRFDIIDIAANGKGDIGRQRPRRGGPCQEIFIIRIFSFEFCGDRIRFYFFVAKRYLMGSQAGSASRAVRQDLVAFIDQSGLEEFLQDPPAAFDIIIVKGNIRVIQIDQITHSLCHLSPLFLVGEDGFLTFLVEFLDAVLLNVLLTGHGKLLFHFDLYREPVGIPAGFSIHFKTLHRLVTAHGVLKRTRDHVMDPGSSVCSRRSFIKYERRHPLSRRNTFA